MRKAYGCAGIMLYVVIVCVMACPVLAEDGHGKSKVGLSASVHDSQMDILLPIWCNNSLVLTPVFGAAFIGDVTTNFDLGLIIRGNLKQGEAVPYLGIRVGALLGKPKNGDGTVDLILGPLFGGEYFLKERFSVGVEAQLNIAVSDAKSYRFSNPDKTNINTATAIFATFYF